MSYHERFGFAVLTEEQLDVWSDTANGLRSYSVSGLTHYVSPTGNDANAGLVSTAPKQHVFSTAQPPNLGGDDIVLLRPGVYNERGSFTNRVTLRATRAGWATIGRPGL